jgi:hypothetical protein
VARRRASRRAQRGQALLALLAVAVMAFAYVLTSRLNAASRFVGVDRDHNAKVLAQAKQALVGWMAMNAAGTDDDPGRLPCPEAPGDFGVPAQEGIAAGSCIPPNNVGRLPWRTLGLDKLVDAAGEPLWYAVSQGWSLPGASTTPMNSDSNGQLSLNGTANDAVALIVAPGAVLSVQAGGTCAAKAQARPAAGPADVDDYLECGNETGAFVTSAAGQTFNDQVLRVAAADVVPALEAAIHQRVQRELVPALKSVYASAPWKRTSASYLSSTNPLYPYPATFSNPGTSSYEGVPATGSSDKPQGLMPFVYSETGSGSGVPCTADPRCDPLFVAWTGGTLSGPSILSPSCSVVAGTTTRLDCTFYYTCPLIFCTQPTLDYTIQVQASNVGMALRQINMSAPVGSANVTATLVSAEGVFNSNGSVSLTLTGTATPDGSGGFLGAVLGNALCGLPLIGSLLGCTESLISVPIGLLADHPLLDAGDPTTGWFVRNQWYRLVYYAASVENTAYSLPSLGCTTGSNCLRSTYPDDLEDIRAVMILTGRSLSATPSRPNSNLADYVEFQNGDGGVIYQQRPISRIFNASLNSPFNDRMVIVDRNP